MAGKTAKVSNVLSASMTSRSKSPNTATQTVANSPSCPVNGSLMNPNGIATWCEEEEDTECKNLIMGVHLLTLTHVYYL